MAVITTADFATELGTDPRTARKFLRHITPKADQPGKGSRWAIEKKDLRGLRTKFAAWELARAEAAQAAAEALATEGDDDVTEGDEG